MREALRDALLRRADDARTVVLTADVGYALFEPLAERLGERFINAGVAEQNMIAVAAALAAQEFEVWVYGIASFTYARAFEHLRNDVGFLGYPVRLVGNGGGYGYGVMGPTHHALDDYGTLLTIPEFTVFVPAFAHDVAPIVERAAQMRTPSYLRLGRTEDADVVLAYAPWRQLLAGRGTIVVTIGPLAASYAPALAGLPADRRPSLWVVGELPLERHPLPDGLLVEIAQSRDVLVAEEHVSQGSLAMQLAYALARAGVAPRHFEALHARHAFDTYGSQTYLRRRDGLAAEEIVERCAR